MPRTIAFLHAHPDDEALLTAGTMARATAEGQRVVLITATAGEAGLADDDMVGAGLGQLRRAELAVAARILGVQRLELLEYPDSGLGGATSAPDGRLTFCGAPTAEVSARVADVLEQEQADTLVIYDPSGGYGHPDHVRVHEVGLAVARQAGTPRLFEATMPRSPFAAAGAAAAAVDRLPGVDLAARIDTQSLRAAYLPRHQITHRVVVRRHLDTKRAAMRAHASQATGASARTLGVLLALPRPVFSALLGVEYYRRLR